MRNATHALVQIHTTRCPLRAQDLPTVSLEQCVFGEVFAVRHTAVSWYCSRTGLEVPAALEVPTWTKA